jgi:hypothetical protein
MQCVCHVALSTFYEKSCFKHLLKFDFSITRNSDKTEPTGRNTKITHQILV